MKKLLWKKENIVYFVMFFVLLFSHLPIMTEHLLTADVLLNNAFYNGFSWEISLGRFGLLLIGLLKGYHSYPVVDTLVSFILIILTTHFLLKLFDVKEIIPRILIGLVMSLSPIISATLLFHYCSIAYFLAFLCGVLSVYFYFEAKNKIFKYGLPVLLIVISLSMYQAYFSLIVTVFMLYQIKQLLNHTIHYKQSGIYLLLFCLGVVLYFICMKLSLWVFHVDMASYSNANSVGISTLLQIPKKFVESYQLFFSMFFTNQMMKNTYLYNYIIYIVLGILFIITMFVSIKNSEASRWEKGLVIILLLLIPVYCNSVIFVIADAKLQLLMSASYLILFVFLLSFSMEKYRMILLSIGMVLLLSIYMIQDQATYITLHHTYLTYRSMIQEALQEYPDQTYLVIGEYKNTDTSLTNKNYGYISDDGIFWDEYHLRKLGFERFCDQTFHKKVSFGEEALYEEVNHNPLDEKIYKYHDTIIINLYAYEE